jgi:hypothetical protein
MLFLDVGDYVNIMRCSRNPMQRTCQGTSNKILDLQTIKFLCNLSGNLNRLCKDHFNNLRGEDPIEKPESSFLDPTTVRLTEGAVLAPRAFRTVSESGQGRVVERLLSAHSPVSACAEATFGDSRQLTFSEYQEMCRGIEASYIYSNFD